MRYPAGIRCKLGLATGMTVLLISLVVFAALRCQRIPATAVVPVRVVMEHSDSPTLLVPVTLPSGVVGQFQLDTGANRLILSDQIAYRIGLRRTSRRIQRKKGEVRLPWTLGHATLPAIWLGNLRVPNVQCTILPAWFIHHQVGADVDGALGMSVLAGLVCHLDVPHGALSIWRPSHAPPLEREALRCRNQDGLLLVPASVGGVPLFMTLDTGATDTSIPGSFIDRLHIRGTRKTRRMLLVSGYEFFRVVRIPWLQAGRYIRRDLTVLAAPDASIPSSLGLDLLAGADLWIDGPHDLVAIGPRA